jgi:pyruvate formate lyase activating enzyme
MGIKGVYIMKKRNYLILLFSFFVIGLILFLFFFKFFARASSQLRPKEAMFYSQLKGGRVRCGLCFRRCIITKGMRGFCRVRENKGGKLYSLVYARPVGLQIDPIELEPMYHMVPGHRNLCVYTASCNFRCQHCHNWHISQRWPEELKPKVILPREVIREAQRRGCKSISHSINEPTIFYEYMYDIVRLAKGKGLMTLFHTNGSIAPRPLKKLLKYMDAVTVDLKGFNQRFYRDISFAELEPVLKTLKIIKQEKVHLEIVNLVIPSLNDNLNDIKKMCRWIKDNLGKDVPLHFTRFSPSYKLSELPPTPIKTLEHFVKIAKNTGLKYVYIGNVPGHKYNNTFCPKCKKRVIHRIHFRVLNNMLKGGRCRFCGYKISGIWK